MASHPFKTPEFKALFQEWNQRLEASGHVEIEDFRQPSEPLKCWHSLKWVNPSGKVSRRRIGYFDEAMELLHIFEFKSEIHKQIWEMHASGMSIRKIAGQINRKKYRRDVVHSIILSIRVASGLRYG